MHSIKEKIKITMRQAQEIAEEVLEKSVNQMNKLFVTYRGRYLTQLGKESNYSFITTKHATLNDFVIRQHLNQSQTIGIKLGVGGLTNFLAFDIDIMNENDRKSTTIKLVDLLNTYYGILKEDIHVWYSGSKGYHVDLYFDNMIPEKSLLPFYKEVLSKLNESSNRIERRPTTGQGVKLPLGKHKKTGYFCCYVDNITLKPLPIEYFLKIKQISLKEFKETILEDCKIRTKLAYKEPKDSDSEEVMLSKKYKEVDGQAIEKGVIKILNLGYLIENSSRNNFTYYASMILKDQGHSQEDCINIIAKILRNTMENPKTRNFLDINWTWESLIKETRRVVKNTYENNWHLNVIKSREVTFYKSEIDQIIKLKRKILKRLLFSLLLHSKKYADRNGIFYCSYSTLSDYGNDSNRGRTRKNILELQKLGLIRVISSGVYIDENKCSPNYYRVELLCRDKEELSKTFSSNEHIEFEDIVKFFHPEE